MPRCDYIHGTLEQNLALLWKSLRSIVETYGHSGSSRPGSGSSVSVFSVPHTVSRASGSSTDTAKE